MTQIDDAYMRSRPQWVVRLSAQNLQSASGNKLWLTDSLEMRSINAPIADILRTNDFRFYMQA